MDRVRAKSILEIIIDTLTANGAMDKSALFDSPFTDIHSQGINGLFTDAQVSDILETLDHINGTSGSSGGSSDSVRQGCGIVLEHEHRDPDGPVSRVLVRWSDGLELWHPPHDLERTPSRTM